ncbi:Crp/Fnr family transcriptional regulator [Kandleria sp.]|jgi:CRP-like cAMP-binding protein|uniref:Crp/Fnr family transcriptional regulator n=1 Tax=Kandleria sp. TaxID=2774291 RepID=UPI001B584668|nr:Crp/Fnr family transcriptional regulator [Kandleria sp.]MBP3276827.1 Crp/Fnr family transcriptional regulator [Kandleria sp.]
MIRIPDQYFKDFMSIGSQRVYKSSETIFHQADEADGVYLILSGRVRVFFVSTDGKELTFEVLKKGRIFGDHSFIDHAIRNVTIQAITDVTLVECSISKLTPLLHESEELMTLMFQHLSETSEHLMHQINRLVYYNSYQKVADLILMSSRYNTLSYSQQDIADCLGMNRVTVARVIQLLKKKQLIETGYGFIRILDRKKLKQFREEAKTIKKGDMKN